LENFVDNHNSIFLCFSSKDRYTVVESVCYHLRNYGLPIWYDRKNIATGDNKNEVCFDNGIKQSKYAIVFVSKNFYTSVCGNDELSVIKEQFYNKKISVIPIFYNLSANELPEQYKWLSNIIYRELTTSTGTLEVCEQIVYKFLKDEVKKGKCRTIENIISHENISSFLYKLFSIYENLDSCNFNAKIAILCAIYIYVETNFDINFPSYCKLSYSRLLSKTNLNLKINIRELQILECTILILINLIV
jgi:hypothetical protein